MRKVAIFLFLLTATFQMWGQYDPEHFYYRGRQALIDGKYAAAIESFNVLAQIDTTSYEAYFYRGIAKYNLGDYNGAEKDFDRTLKKNPLYTPAYHYRAITLSRTGRYEDALKDLEEAVELRPSYTGLYFSRGVTYFLSQQFELAVKDFDRFIKREPKEGAAYLNRGASYLFLGDTTKALNDYNSAIKINRYDPEGYIRRSRVFALQENIPAAIEDLDQAILLDKENTLAYFNRALLKFEGKNLAGAIADLDKVLQYEPGNALTLYNRALIYASLGELEKALDDFDRVININPDNVLAYFNRAAVFLEMERWRDAMDDYSRAINLYPDFAKAYMNRSYVKSKLGQFNSSKKDYEIAQEKIREYKAKTSSEEGYKDFADTTKKYDRLLALDADFAKENFDNELLQYRDVDIRLKPLFKFVSKEQDSESNVAAIGRRQIYEQVDQFLSTVPIEMTIASIKGVNTESLQKNSAIVNQALREERTAGNLFAKAVMECDTRQYNSAMVYYDEAIMDNPTNPYLYINRGVLQSEMIDFISSMDNNVQVLTLENEYTTRTRVQEGATRNYDYTAALHDMTKAKQLAPDYPYIYYNLGNLYCLSNDLPESILQYTKAIEINPYIGEAYYNRGLVQIYLKDKEKGCMDLSTAGELGIADAYSVIKKYCTEQEP